MGRPIRPRPINPTTIVLTVSNVDSETAITPYSAGPLYRSKRPESRERSRRFAASALQHRAEVLAADKTLRRRVQRDAIRWKTARPNPIRVFILRLRQIAFEHYQLIVVPADYCSPAGKWDDREAGRDDAGHAHHLPLGVFGRARSMEAGRVNRTRLGCALIDWLSHPHRKPGPNGTL
jgi:hypothetical protein